MFRYACFLSFICICLFLAACSGEGTSEPIQYPREFSVETSSSMAETSSFEIPESSEAQSSSSSTSFLCIIGTEENCEYGTLTDERDGHVYKTMKIGDQEWMADDLYYRIKSCYHDNCAAYEQHYYSWKTAMDSVGVFSTNGVGCGFGRMCSPDYPVRGICPAGWHLPSNFEIEQMISELGKLREFAAQGGDSSTEVLFVKQFLTHLEFWSSTEENWYSAPILTCGKESCSLFPATSFKTNKVNVRCIKGQNAEQNMDKLLSSSSQNSSSSEIKSSSSVIIVPCKTETDDKCEYGTLVDERDGQAYKTVRIGNQIWMAENLNYAYLQPTSTLDSSSWCYDNDPVNCEKYGRLYLWSAAIDSAALFSINGKGFGYGDDCGTLARPKKCSPDIPLRGACPSGWHLTSTEEWLDLLFAIDGDLASLLKSRNEWPDDLGGRDAFGFGALPSGMASSRGNTVSYWQLGEYTDFWTSVGESTTAWTSGVLSEDDFSWKWDALPVRCIKDVLENE